MSNTEISNKIQWIFTYNFKVDSSKEIFNSSLSKDLGLNRWEVNLLLYYIELSFNIKLKSNIDAEVDTLNQIYGLVLNEKSKSKFTKSGQIATAS